MDLAKPGDRVTITGVYRAVGVRVNPRLRELKAVFKTYLDIVHIQVHRVCVLKLKLRGGALNAPCLWE